MDIAMPTVEYRADCIDVRLPPVTMNYADNNTTQIGDSVEITWFEPQRTFYKSGADKGKVKNVRNGSLTINVSRPWYPEVGENELTEEQRNELDALVQRIGEEAATKIADFMSTTTGKPVQIIDKEFEDAWFESHPDADEMVTEAEWEKTPTKAAWDQHLASKSK